MTEKRSLTAEETAYLEKVFDECNREEIDSVLNRSEINRADKKNRIRFYVSIVMAFVLPLIIFLVLKSYYTKLTYINSLYLIFSISLGLLVSLVLFSYGKIDDLWIFVAMVLYNIIFLVPFIEDIKRAYFPYSTLTFITTLIYLERFYGCDRRPDIKNIEFSFFETAEDRSEKIFDVLDVLLPVIAKTKSLEILYEDTNRYIISLKDSLIVFLITKEKLLSYAIFVENGRYILQDNKSKAIHRKMDTIFYNVLKYVEIVNEKSKELLIEEEKKLLDIYVKTPEWKENINEIGDILRQNRKLILISFSIAICLFAYKLSERIGELFWGGFVSALFLYMFKKYF